MLVGVLSLCDDNLQACEGQLFWKAAQTHGGDGEADCDCVTPTGVGGRLSSQCNSACAGRYKLLLAASSTTHLLF